MLTVMGCWIFMYVIRGPGTDEEREMNYTLTMALKNGVPYFHRKAQKNMDWMHPAHIQQQLAFFDMDNDGDLDMFW